MAIPSTADTVLWRVHFRSSPEHVFGLLNSDAGRASFWSESAVEVDGAIRFRAKNGNTWESQILDRVPGNRLTLDYGGTVTFDLVGDGEGGTDLTLTHTGFEPGDRDDVLAGWLNILLPFKARADFNIDLRNDDPGRDWAHGYVDH
jgi:uncharacterized protein YndB with AHSA1/START domain